ncbi:MAG: MATE family efflux transporter [Bacteroidales bacterium]
MKTRDLTKGNILNQLLKLALPIMATGFIQMTYNLVDIAWIGRLGSQSVAAVGSSGMLMWMLTSFGLISKIGAEISIGRALGEGNRKRMQILASHTTIIAVIMGVLFGVMFFTFPNLFISFFYLDSSINALANSYLTIISFGIPFMFLILNFSGIYIGGGRSDIPFYFNASGLVLNIILDPILIFGYLGFPALGVDGAAIATVISQITVFTLFITHIKGKNGILGKTKLLIRPIKRELVYILKLGLPVALMNAYFSIISMSLARIASIHGGHIGVTSQSTGGQIEGITWNTAHGFASALGSFVAQNFGAKKEQRAAKAYIYTLIMLGALGVVVSVLFITLGENIFALFIPEKEAYIAGGSYLLIIGISQVFMMVEIATQGLFNGIGKTAPPAIISIVFNTIRIPLSLILASVWGVNGVWWAISITTIFKGCISPLWMLIYSKKKKLLSFS